MFYHDSTHLYITLFIEYEAPSYELATTRNLSSPTVKNSQSKALHDKINTMLSVNAHHWPLRKDTRSFNIYSPACCNVLELHEALWGGVKFIDGGVDVVEHFAGVTEFLRVGHSQKEPVIDLKHLPVNCSKCLKWKSSVTPRDVCPSDQHLLPQLWN